MKDSAKADVARAAVPGSLALSAGHRGVSECARRCHAQCCGHSAMRRNQPPISRRLLQLGLGLELTHTATLVHDDIIDNDCTRRGAATVWKLYGVAHAITAGDLLFFLAEEAIHASPLDVDAKLTALHLGARQLRRMAYGQSAEIEARRRRLVTSVDEYRSVVRNKTGALIGLGLAYGALCARSREPVEQLIDLGDALGELYQYADDVHDIAGEKAIERGYSDLREGVTSLPIVLCLHRLGDVDHQQLRSLLFSPPARADERIHPLRELLVRCGASRGKRRRDPETGSGCDVSRPQDRRWRGLAHQRDGSVRD